MWMMFILVTLENRYVTATQPANTITDATIAISVITLNGKILIFITTSFSFSIPPLYHTQKRSLPVENTL